jgi:hypothetical protein
MADVMQDIADLLVKIEDGELEQDDLDPSAIYVMLSRAAGEIDRLRRVNSEQGWRLNPDRMGGQFTQEEIDRSRDGWN